MRSTDAQIGWTRWLKAQEYEQSFWQQLAPLIRTPHGRLHCVRLYETPRNYAEYFGPDHP